MAELTETSLNAMFRVHFFTDDWSTVTCADCLDCKMRQCEGKGLRGIECLDCIRNHAAKMHDVAVN